MEQAATRPQRGRAMGIDVGVTNIKLVCVAADGTMLARRSFQTHATKPDWPAYVKACLADLEDDLGPADWVGLSAPGVARADGSSIRWMQGRLDAVQGLNWSTELERPVPVLNDAQAALLAEAWVGAAKGISNAIMLTLGTGVGGAAIVDGRLLRGWLGRAGHLGHICLDIDGPQDICRTPGSLETMIGNYTIVQRSDGRFATTHELIQACRNGDEFAVRIWETSVRALACGVISLINVLDPQVVVIGGGISAAGELLLGPLRREMARITWQLEDETVRVELARLGEYAGAIGAAREAMLKGNAQCLSQGMGA